MSIQSRSHQYGTVFENWQIQDLLGQGSDGKTAVFRLKRIDSPRGQSALKVVNLIEERGNYDSMPSYLKKDYETAREECKSSALQEVWLMDDFQGNSNIVDYLDHLPLIAMPPNLLLQMLRWLIIGPLILRHLAHLLLLLKMIRVFYKVFCLFSL